MDRRTFLAAAGAAPAPAAAQPTPAGWSAQQGAESDFYVKEGAIVVHENGAFPARLRSDRQ